VSLQYLISTNGCHTLKFSWTFGLVMSREGGSADGLRCSQSPSVARSGCHSKEPTSSLHYSFVIWLLQKQMGATIIAPEPLEVDMFLPEKRSGKSHINTILVSAFFGNSEILHSQPFSAA